MAVKHLTLLAAFGSLAFAFLGSPANAEGKCSRNADELKGDMVSMMPDGTYCEMDDGAKAKAKNDMASYNASLGSAGADGRVYGNGSMFYAKSYRAAKILCARQTSKMPNCEEQMAASLASSYESTYKRCVERGETQNACQMRSETSLDYYINSR